MANIGDEQKISSNIQAAEGGNDSPSRETSVDRKVKDREEKLKLARDRQNEERQRKIEELKAQAEAAQRFREQKEEERKRRIDEIRLRDTEKRHQVEERKKAILAAENERREYILKKNQERESRLELKKRERISSAFAFGSSTPRLLEPAEFGMVSPSSFWSNRRSTSVSNVAGASITRRGSERELTDCGSKKRATSASGTERCDDDNVDTSHITFRSVARRKTDLMPTIPSPREGGGHYSSKSSLSNTPRTPVAGTRSENVTPGGSMNASRPNSAMSTSTLMSVSGYVPRRTAPFIRKQRPISIAGTGVSLEEINKLKKDIRAPIKSSTLPPPAQVASKRTSNLMSSSMNAKSSSRLSIIDKKTTTLKKDPMSAMKSSTSKLTLKTTNSDNKEQKSKYNSLSTTKSKAFAFDNDNAVVSDTEARIKSKDEKNALNAVQTMEETNTVTMVMPEDEPSMEMVLSSSIYMIGDGDQVLKRVTPPSTMTKKAIAVDVGTRDDTEIASENASEMTASMIARNRITTEEEAKAALAEKRRLVREEAEKQAELERQRLEAEYLAEMKRQEEEAERQQQFEEEAIRLAEEQRKAEDERLRQAIEEAKQREEEERRKREREEKQRIERYEIEKRAKEEAEKQRLEIAERLKREEKERKDRKKRVEAIMSRTRKTESTALSNSTPTKENNATVLSEEHRKSAQQIIESMQDNNSSSNNDGGDTTSGSSTTATSPIVTVGRTVVNTAPMESPGSQAIYEQSVKAAEISLMKGFSAIIIDENTKKNQQMSQQQQSQIVEMANGRMHTNYDKNDVLLQNTTNSTVANGNGHIENINNKNDINILPTNQIIDITIGSQDINNSVNYNNNNNLLPTNALVSADSHENSDISLL